jgi:hypothetical protein
MNRAEIIRRIVSLKDIGENPIAIRKTLDPVLRQFSPGKFEGLGAVKAFEELPLSDQMTFSGARGAHEWVPEKTNIYLKPLRAGVNEGYITATSDVKTPIHELWHDIQTSNPEFAKELDSETIRDLFQKMNQTGALVPDYTGIRTNIRTPREFAAEGLARLMLKPESLNKLPTELVDLLKDWYRKYKLIPLAAGGAALGMGTPDEAEAFQVGKAKPLTEAVKQLQNNPFSISSAAEALKGKFIQGMEIIDVLTKGKGDERFVLLKNPESNEIFQWPIDKEAVSTLAATKGYETYMERFKALGSKNPLGKFEQAQTSMNTRIKKGLTGILKDIKPWTTSYLTKSHMLSPFGESNLEEMPDLVFVRWKGNTMNLPRWYADFLDYMQRKPTNNYIKRELKDFQILKTETKYYTHFAQKKGTFNPKEEYQYAILENGELKFNDEKGEMFKATGDELNYWLSSKGMKKQEESGIKILTLSEIQDYIEKLGGIG